MCRNTWFTAQPSSQLSLWEAFISHPIRWENVCADHTSAKGSVFRGDKELLWLNNSKTTEFKMGQGLEQTWESSPKKTDQGQLAREKTFHTLSIRETRESNPKWDATSPDNSSDSKTQAIASVVKDVQRRAPALFGGMYAGAATVESRRAVAEKVPSRITVWSGDSTCRCIAKGTGSLLWRSLQSCVLAGLFPRAKRRKSPKRPSVDNWITKRGLWNNGILTAFKKEGHPDTGCDIDEPYSRNERVAIIPITKRPCLTPPARGARGHQTHRDGKWSRGCRGPLGDFARNIFTPSRFTPQWIGCEAVLP